MILKAVFKLFKYSLQGVKNQIVNDILDKNPII